MAKKLMVYASNTYLAWRILGEYAGCYGDNGGEPDGNTWLPSNQDDIPAELAQKVVDANCGEMVEVLLGTDEGMCNYLGLSLPSEDETGEELRERIEGRCDTLNIHWAHYGAYGAMDSHWIIIKPEE